LTSARKMNGRLAKIVWKNILKNRCMIVNEVSVSLSREKLEGVIGRRTSVSV